MAQNSLKIEVLKFEEDESFTVLDDDLIEYVEDPQFVEYEYIEVDETPADAEKWNFNQNNRQNIKTEDYEEFKTEDKNLIIKLETDQQYHDQRDEIYKCSNRKCKRENILFPTQQELDAHNLMHLEQINCNTCPICNKTLANASKLHFHMETRHIPKNFFCDNCSKVFKSKDNLRLHMSHHRKHFLVECKACKKTYKSMQSLRYHLRQHFEHHQCETCGKVFEHKKLLIGHIAAKHNQELMIQCRFCTRMFSRNDVREAHERDIHKNGEMGSHFKCNECDCAFDLRENLMRHKILNHYSGVIHTCEECGKSFKKKSLLHLHMNCHLEKSIQCDVCKMMFTFITGLAKHKKLGRCKGPASKSIKDMMTKEEIARIAKQQLIEITVNPSIKSEVNVFSDINDENVVFKVPAAKKPVVAKRRDVKRSPLRKPKLMHFKIMSLPTRNRTSDGPEIVQSSSLYKRKPIVTIRTLTQREIDQQKVEATAAAAAETFVSSSGRIIKRKLPMTFPQLPFKPINIMKKTNIPFECDKCGEKLDSKLRLVSHLKNHRRGNKHQCPNCNRAFGNIASLKKHCATAHYDDNPFKEKRFQCDLCPKKYMTDFLLGQHKLSHDNLKDQKCPECPFATNAPYDLKNHIKRIHYPTKDYVCLEVGCGKTFKRRCDMENHRKSVHSKIRVYVKCPTCDVIVLEKGLQSHIINRHSEKASKKPFVCTICGKAERYEKNLQRHYEAVHEPNDRGVSYMCPDCPMSFFRRRDLTAHSFDHFDGTLHTCQECGNKYKSKKELTNHLYSHRCKEWPCHICKAVFQTKSGRSKHIRKHENYDNIEVTTFDQINVEVEPSEEIFII